MAIAHPMKAPVRPSERAKIATLIALAGVGGYVDAVSYLGLGRVFTAAMTGNTVLLALAVAEQHWSAVSRSAVAVIGFVSGVAVGQLVVSRCEARTRWPRAVGSGLLLEAAFLALLATGLYMTGPQPLGWVTYPLIAVSALAMGVQSSTARMLGIAAVSTTYITGTLTSLTSGLIDWLRAPRQRTSQQGGAQMGPIQPATVYGPGLPAAAWLIYALAALMGGLVVMTMTQGATMLAVLVLVILALADRALDR